MEVSYLLLYLAAINIVGAVINIADKHKARKRKWRIKERTLWLIALLGGAPLSYVTMILIRHKTQHKSFMILMPILSVVQIALMFFLLYNIF